MKLSFLILVITLLFPNLFAQDNKSNSNFAVVNISEHGFFISNDTLYYKVHFELKNKTNYKLKKTCIYASIPQLDEFNINDCNSIKMYFMPNSTSKVELILSNGYYHNDNFIESFDKTPQDILLMIRVRAHNIDKDFDEIITKLNIHDDWVYFQKVLGLREIKPDENIKIIELKKNIIVKNNPVPKTIENKLYYVMSGRKPLLLPKPELKCQSSGKVVVEITVNNGGIVTKAVAGIRGSTTLDECLLEASEKAAMQSSFEVSENAPAYQKGSITYHFMLQ